MKTVHESRVRLLDVPIGGTFTFQGSLYLKLPGEHEDRGIINVGMACKPVLLFETNEVLNMDWDNRVELVDAKVTY